MTEGLVSIIMGVHNEPENYLRSAINSICNQTYPHIEFIIIDDASNDTCKSSLIRLCSNKKNITLIHNKSNLGLTASLNLGLRMANGEFIARMDADDISVHNRIEKQVEFMYKHPSIDILGTGVVTFGSKTIFMSPPLGYWPKPAQCNLFFSSTLCHPSVMMRKSFLEKYALEYDDNIKAGQDYDLWERASVHGNIMVLKDILHYYRLHEAQITSTNRIVQSQTAEMIQKRRLSRIGITPSTKEYKCHQLLCGGKDKNISYKDVKLWIEKILQCNAKVQFVDNEVLKKNLQSRFTIFKLRNRVSIFDFRFVDIVCIKNYLKSRRQSKKMLKEANEQFIEFATKNGYEE